MQLNVWTWSLSLYDEIVAQLTPHMGQVEPRVHFFLESHILKTVYFRSKFLIPWDAPHPKIYEHILVGGITVMSSL